MRVFISSTSKDLQEYRQATFRAIHGLGHFSDDMIYWSAEEHDGSTTSVDRVRQCDIVVLLLAHRYGYIPDGSDASVTELEWRAARAADIPVLAFFVDEETPWPPAYVEWEQRDRLRSFKAEVERTVTRKTFRTPDDLATQVTQALASFVQRRSAVHFEPSMLLGLTLVASAPTVLRHQPDAVVQIGTAEDGLPLLLEIRRANDIAPWFRDLAEAISAPGQPAPDAMLDAFRQSIERYAHGAWAAARLLTVERLDGSSGEFYVSQNSLSRLFVSLLTRLLGASMVEAELPFDPEEESTLGSHSLEARLADLQSGSGDTVNSGTANELQSVGGSNRFLGVSLDTGELITAGWRDDRWVEWRRYLPESVIGPLPSTRLVVDGLRIHRDFEANLLEVALGSVGRDGARARRWPPPTTVEAMVSRQDIGKVLRDVAVAAAELHAAGRIHGDLKPQNVLLPASGVVLIDSFNLTEGHFSPGWTPQWSAPEQLLGVPLTAAADVYPLGVAIARLLGAAIVGEVRKFKTKPTATGQSEFDVFYDPQLSPVVHGSTATASGFLAWSRTARKCLLFDPEDRIGSMRELADQLSDLLDSHPLAGDIRIPISGRLAATSLIDGSTAIGHVLTDARR